MRKVNSHTEYIEIGKAQIFQRCFSYILCEGLIPWNIKNRRKVNFHNKEIIWENTTILKWRVPLLFFFLFLFAWRRNPCSSQNMVWMRSDVTGKVWENTKIPKLWVLYIFHVKQKSNTIFILQDKLIHILRNKYSKTQVVHYLKKYN